jgi:hypothetical protein
MPETTDQKAGGSNPSERAHVRGPFRSWKGASLLTARLTPRPDLPGEGVRSFPADETRSDELVGVGPVGLGAGRASGRAPGFAGDPQDAAGFADGGGLQVGSPNHGHGQRM